MLVDFSKAPDDVLGYFVDLRNDLDAFFMYLSSFYGVELHRKAMRLFREYMLVGGMPQAVSKYVETHDFSKVDNVKRNILRLYRQDISKHGGSDRIRITRIFDNLVGQLSKKEKKFNITSLGKEAKTRDYEDAFFWLSNAFITNDCFNSTDPSVGLSISEDHSTVKCYAADTGLLTTLTWPTRNRPEATYTGTSSWNASKSTRACSRRTSSHSFSGPTGTGCSSTRAATATTRRTVWRSTSSLSNRMRTRR